MSSTSFSTTSSMSTNSKSFQTISSDESAEDDVIYCENNLCIYWWTSNRFAAGAEAVTAFDGQLHMSHAALRPLKNQKTTQGTVYKCDLIKHHTSSTPTVIKTIVKTSKHIDFVIENEVEAWKRVSVFDSPHFAKVIKTVPVSKRENNLVVFFEEVSIGMENGKYISGSHCLYHNQLAKKECISLSDLLKDPDRHPSAALNCVRQALAAIVMYENVGITHYDLHADNIMIRNTPYDIHVYKFQDTIIPIMTFGIAPVIIDFGLAHINNSGWTSTNLFLYQGLSSFIKDPIIDCILLLTTVKTHMEFHNSWIVSNYIQEMETYCKYIKYVTKWFKHLNLDKNGWFKRQLFPDTVYDMLQSFPKVEYGIFSTKNITCVIDLLQYSIVVPIEKLEHPKFTFKQALLRLCVVWIETVEPVFNNIRREKMLFKDLVVYVAKHKNRVDIPDIVKLKKRYNNILNFHRLISTVCCLRDTYSDRICKLSPSIETIKQNLYAKVAQKSTLDFLNDVPFVNYLVKPGMKVLVQDVEEKSRHVFTTDKCQAAKINSNPFGFYQIINNICKRCST